MIYSEKSCNFSTNIIRFYTDFYGFCLHKSQFSILTLIIIVPSVIEFRNYTVCLGTPLFILSILFLNKRHLFSLVAFCVTFIFVYWYYCICCVLLLQHFALFWGKGKLICIILLKLMTILQFICRLVHNLINSHYKICLVKVATSNLTINNKLEAPRNSIWKKISLPFENNISPKTMDTICVIKTATKS